MTITVLPLLAGIAFFIALGAMPIVVLYNERFRRWLYPKNPTPPKNRRIRLVVFYVAAGFGLALAILTEMLFGPDWPFAGLF